MSFKEKANVADGDTPMLSDIELNEELTKLSVEQIELANGVVRRLHPLSGLNFSDVLPFMGELFRKCGCKTEKLDGAFNRVQKTLAADSRVDVFEAEDKDVDYD